MNIEVGQWYRCKEDGYLAHVVGPITNDSYKFVAVLYVNGRFEETGSFTSNGRFYDDGDQCSYDLVEHLPDCTGPDWKPHKWRPATVEDLKDGVKRARFRNFSTGMWIESHLRGARWKGTTLEWHDLLEDRFWLYCEVLDD